VDYESSSKRKVESFKFREGFERFMVKLGTQLPKESSSAHSCFRRFFHACTQALSQNPTTPWAKFVLSVVIDLNPR